MANDAIDRLFAALQERGWTSNRLEAVKGEWQLFRDSGEYLVLQTEHNERTFDVGVGLANFYYINWMANVVEHLARMEDERARLRGALESIRADPDSGPSASSAAETALASCYHTWLVDTSDPRYGTDTAKAPVFCPVCGRREEASGS